MRSSLASSSPDSPLWCSACWTRPPPRPCWNASTTPSASSRPRRMRWVSRLRSTESAIADNKKPRDAGLFYEQGDQFTQLATKPPCLSDKADPFQILGPIDAIFAAPRSVRQPWFVIFFVAACRILTALFGVQCLKNPRIES